LAKQESDRQAKAAKAADKGDDIVEVRGCGKSLLYSCGWATRTVNNRSQSTVRSCRQQNYPADMTPW
jgi:hypothetical protein